jgi:hypothetical protein
VVFGLMFLVSVALLVASRRDTLERFGTA